MFLVSGFQDYSLTLELCIALSPEREREREREEKAEHFFSNLWQSHHVIVRQFSVVGFDQSFTTRRCAPRGETLIKPNHLIRYLQRSTTAYSSIFLQYTRIGMYFLSFKGAV